MSRANQLHPVPLGQVSFAAGGNATLKFDRALAQVAGRLAHLRKITMTCKATPTLSSGSATAEELQKAVKNFTVKDNVRKLFEGSFRSLRLFEMLENGFLTIPEPDAAATTEQVVFTRVFDLAIKSFEDPNDFLQALATFSQGSLYFGFGALTDVDANCTALTMTIDVVAWVTILDDILMPPLVERIEQDVVKSVGISAEALYAFIAMADTSAFGAIANGDIGEIQVSNEGSVGEQVDVRCLRDGYYDDMGVGFLSQVAGEPSAATDDNAKVASGTALAAAAAQLQPVVWSGHGSRISKLIHAARPNISFKWSGTQATLYGLFTRLIPRTTDFYGKYLAAIRQGLPINPSTWELKPRTLSKRDYVGPRREYMGIKLKAPRAVGG